MKLFLTAALLSSMFISCDYNSEYPTTQTKWLVGIIKSNNKNTNIYYVHPIEKNNLNINETWIVDSIGKFKVGDTLSFQLQ